MSCIFNSSRWHIIYIHIVYYLDWEHQQIQLRWDVSIRYWLCCWWFSSNVDHRQWIVIVFFQMKVSLTDTQSFHNYRYYILWGIVLVHPLCCTSQHHLKTNLLMSSLFWSQWNSLCLHCHLKALSIAWSLLVFFSTFESCWVLSSQPWF